MDRAQAAILTEELINKTVSGWTLTERLGYGKSAVVMKAQKGGEIAAIKIFHPELIERYGKEIQLERIKRELQLVGHSHQNLVTILGGGECADTGYLFVMMGYVPYKNLKEVLSEIPKTKFEVIVAQIAAGAKFLEDRGLTHRDIKPENIAISPDFNNIVLLDLGVIRPVAGADLTNEDQRVFIGTLRYSSPEFLQREEEDSPLGWRAVTFYQIGAVLHDLLMGIELFSEFSDPYSRLVEAVLHEKPHLEGENSKLLKLCSHCLVKSPATRLELVDWESFFNPQGDINEELGLLNEIKIRQKYFESQTATSGILDNEKQRIFRIRLEEVLERFNNRIDEVIRDQDCFPVRKTFSGVNIEKNLCKLCLKFTKDPRKGLNAYLTICFVIKLVDKQDDIFELASYAYLKSIDEDQTTELDGDRILVGGESDLLAYDTLVRSCLTVLNSSYAELAKNQEFTELQIK